jgi:hypothetical protein
LSYRGDDEVRLQYLIAAPSFEAGKEYPLWIFQPGDGNGNIKDTFEPSGYQKMMDEFAQANGVALVMPQLRRQLSNNPRKYCELDFYERIADL